MRYSVWNGKGYDYYQAPGALREGVFAHPPVIGVRRRLGVSPEEAATRLPFGAVLVGRGLYPLGTIATRKGLGAFSLGGEFKRLLIYGAIAYVVWFKVLGTEQRQAVKRRLPEY